MDELELEGGQERWRRNQPPFQVASGSAGRGHSDHIEWIDLPWNKVTEDSLDIRRRGRF